MSDVDFEELVTRGMEIPRSKISFIFFLQKKLYLFTVVQFFGPVSQGNFLYNLGLDQRLTVKKKGQLNL